MECHSQELNKEKFIKEHLVVNLEIKERVCNFNKILQNITNSLFSGCEIAKIGNKNIGCVLPSSLQPKLDKEK